MMHPSILRLNDALGNLRTDRREPLHSLGKTIAPGISLSIDTEGSNYSIEALTSASALLSIKAQAEKPGRWLTLNFELDKAGFSEVALIGMALRLRATRAVIMRAAIRTYGTSGHEDVFFPDIISAYPEPGEHCDVLWIGSAPSLQTDAEWRTLILFLDPAGFDLTLTDLRFFSA